MTKTALVVARPLEEPSPWGPEVDLGDGVTLVPAAGHHFGDALRCVRCDVHYNDHSTAPVPCTEPQDPEPPQPAPVVEARKLGECRRGHPQRMTARGTWRCHTCEIDQRRERRADPEVRERENQKRRERHGWRKRG